MANLSRKGFSVGNLVFPEKLRRRAEGESLDGGFINVSWNSSAELPARGQHSLPQLEVRCTSQAQSGKKRKQTNKTSLDISNRENLIQALVARVLEWLER